jgi:hypothetical protein
MCNPLDTRRPRVPRMVLMLLDVLSVPVVRHEAAGFNSHDSLATINSVTRLNRVHLYYGSYPRLFYTLHNSLPPYEVKLLDPRTGIRESTGISPAGFISIYTRLVAYRGVGYLNNIRWQLHLTRCTRFGGLRPPHPNSPF